MDHHPSETRHHHDHHPAAGDAGHAGHADDAGADRGAAHAEQQHFLDADAQVFGDNLSAALDVAGVTGARSIVDLGAGSGAGSRLLRIRYPGAVVTCVDNDPQMLAALRGQGFPVAAADLDEGFPASMGSVPAPEAGVPTPVDLVWASSSFHHLADPERVLSGAHSALAPSGVLLVVELEGLPRFLQGDREVLLEARCHAAAAEAGWNRHPDWTPIVEAAGFTVIRSEVTTQATVTPAAREYARQWFMRFARLEGLTPADRQAVVALLPRFSSALDLQPCVTRTVWRGTPTGGGQQT